MTEDYHKTFVRLLRRESYSYCDERPFRYRSDMPQLRVQEHPEYYKETIVVKDVRPGDIIDIAGRPCEVKVVSNSH